MTILFLAVIWLALLGVALIPMHDSGQSRRVGMWFILALPVVFLGQWQLAHLVVPVLAWLFWLGDNDSWFWNASQGITALFAGGVTALIAVRVMLRRAPALYASLNVTASGIALLFVGGFYVHHFLEQADGLSPESAARKVLLRYHNLPPETIRLARTTTEADYREFSCVTFAGTDDSGPRCRITVCPHGWWWWKQTAVYVFPARDKELARAKEWMQTNPRDAPLILKQIVEDYPGTREADEAKRLLHQLGHH